MEGTRRVLTVSDVERAAKHIAHQLNPANFSAVYGVPRGGIPAAFAVQAAWEKVHGRWIPMLPHGYAIGPATLIVDDVYDSGKTMEPFLKNGYTCAVLAWKGDDWSYLPNGLHAGDSTFSRRDWVVFPWEDEVVSGPDDAVRRLLQYIGEDPDAPHLQETPRRFLSWLSEFRAGQEPDFNATKFEVRYDGMVIARDIPFTSLCAHHLLPFSGHATVAYIPAQEHEMAPPVTHTVLGLSKLARIVQHKARRLQSQEEMTTQIREGIGEAAGSPDVAVLLSAEHSCMNFRGPRVPGTTTVTSSISGKFWEPEVRQEFLSLARASA